MPIKSFRKIPGIRARIFIAGILPALLISALLGYYYIDNWIQSADERLQKNGSRYSEDLAKLSEFALFTKNIDFISALSMSIFSDQDVYSVRIMDNKMNVISHEVAPRYSGEPPVKISEEMIYISAVHGGQLTTFNDEDFFGGETADPYPDLLGWVEVVMTDNHVIALRHEMLINALFILLTVTGAAFFLSLYMAAHITRPITNIKNSVNKIAAGDLTENINRKSGTSNELVELENAFYDMAVTVKDAQFELQKKIDTATARYIDTIGNLEKSNQELLRARESMEEANKEKSTFLARMSHEIRTPIHSIIGFVNLIKRTDLDRSQSEYVRIVEHASDHLLQLINDVLKISSMQTNSIKLDNENINLRDSIEDVALFMSPAAHKKGLELVFLIDSDVPTHLVSDQYHLKQIIMNLVGNAIKFTTRGEVIISVSLLSNSIDFSKLSISVSDTGIGIAPDQIDNIQNPFFQVDASKSRGYEGVGLGLSIVKTLAGMMGGELLVQSEQGKGSRFDCVLELEKQKTFSPEKYQGDLYDKKVLCFDEHPLALRSIRNQTLMWTSKVYTAASLDRAEELLINAENDNEPFDLIMAGVNKEMSDSEIFKSVLGSIMNSHSSKLLLLIGDEGSHSCTQLSHNKNCICIIKPVAHTYLYRTIKSIFNSGEAEAPSEKDGVPVNTPPADNHQYMSSGIKILLAEDNDFNRLYVSSLINDCGFEVIEAVTGIEALNLAKQKKFDLIIMDIHLPEMDGLEASSRIKNDATLNAETTIVALTADIYLHENTSLKAAGISGVINKPVNEAEFRHTLNEYLGAKITDPDGGRTPRQSNDIKTGNLDGIKKGLLPQLVSELPDHNKRINAAFINGDRAGLAEHLHQLKGVAGYFQLSELSVVAAQADDYVRSDEQLGLDGVRPFIQRIDEKIQAIISSEFV